MIDVDFGGWWIDEEGCCGAEITAVVDWLVGRKTNKQAADGVILRNYVYYYGDDKPQRSPWNCMYWTEKRFGVWDDEYRKRCSDTEYWNLSN